MKSSLMNFSLFVSLFVVAACGGDTTPGRDAGNLVSTLDGGTLETSCALAPLPIAACGVAEGNPVYGYYEYLLAGTPPMVDGVRS